jgi:hypothetical protein
MFQGLEFWADQGPRQTRVAIGFRVETEIKAALAKAARRDCRTVSGFAKKILAEWLRQNGYLPEPKSKKPRA